MSWWKRLWIPVAYLAITLVMTYPAVFHLGDQILNSGRDGWIFWWNNWWVKRALTMGEYVYFTRHLFFPGGVDLTYHSFSWLNTALWLVLEPFLGETAAYNLTVLWVFPLAAWGMELLVRELTGSKRAAFLAGLVYAFVPYRLFHYNHLTLIGTQWFPFYTLYLLRAIRDGRPRHVLLASLFLVLTALVGWNLFIYLAIWTAWIAGYAWFSRMGTFRRLAGVLTYVFLIGGLALSPLLVPMLSRFGVEDTTGNVEQYQLRENMVQTDLLEYLLPNRVHPLWGEAVTPIYDRVIGRRQVVYLGYIVMVLLGYGLARRDVRRQTKLWWGGILLWWLMALGPFLTFHGHTYRNIPLPYYPLSKLYVFQLLKTPRRYNLMLSLPVAVVVGYATTDLLARLKGKSRVAVLALSALILFEYLCVPLKMQPLQVSPFYEQLIHEEGEFGIVELPIGFHGLAKDYMLYQTVHGRPIVEGHVSRRPAEATAFLDAHPLLRALYQTQEIDPQLTDVSRQLRTLRDAGFRYVIIHKQLMDVEHVAHWRDYLTIAPRYEDDDLVVFTTDPQPGIDFTTTPVPGQALGIIRAAVTPGSLPAGEKMSLAVRWGAIERPNNDFDARFSLVDAQEQTRQQWTMPLVEGWPTSEWEAGDLAIAVYPLTLPNSLQPGRYTVTVALEDPVAGIASPPLEIGTVQAYASQPEVDQVGEGYQLGEHIHLRRARLSAETLAPGDTLSVVLIWESDGNVKGSYTVFCHISSEDGKLVAQQDGIPLYGVRPTTSWRAGESIKDSHEIPLSGDLASGEYELSVGMYDAESMERLPVYDATGERLSGDRIVLGTLRVEMAGTPNE